MENQKIGLTIFLLKSEQAAAVEAVLLKSHDGALTLSPPLEGFFLPLPSAVREPHWLPIINSVVETPTPIILNGQSPAGLLVVRRESDTFVVTFGHAWQLLKDEWLERDFGRRIAVNSIARDQLVEIKAEQVFARWHVASERAPRASSVDEFGVEFDRDLVAAVEGVTSEPLLAGTIRGSTSLRVNVPFSDFAAVLDKSAVLFKSDQYKKTWPEIDNVSPVRDQILTDRLEAQLDAELASGEAQKKTVMFTPMHKREETTTIDSYVLAACQSRLL